MYWTNPQFAITLKDPADEDQDRKCTLVVSLMQKDNQQIDLIPDTEADALSIFFSFKNIQWTNTQ